MLRLCAQSIGTDLLFKACDELRDSLRKLGVIVEDGLPASKCGIPL